MCRFVVTSCADVRRGITYYLDGRLFEWTFSLCSLWLAVAIFIWPDIIVISAFRSLTELMESSRIAVLSLVVGIVGMIALSTNGRSFVVGPVVRSICAIVRAFLWAQFAYALYLWGLEHVAPSLVLGFWTLFAMSEIYLAYRAMIDVRRRVMADVDRIV